MELKFIQTHATGGDGTAPYDVTIENGHTIRELIEEIAKRKEWGYISVNGTRYEYRYSSYAPVGIEPIPENILNSIAPTKFMAAGGWSCMDYYIDFTESM